MAGNGVIMGWPWQRDKSLDGVDLMQVVPQTLVNHVTSGNGRVTLLVPRFRTGWAAHLMQPRLPEDRRYVRVVLEERGSVLWPLINGRRRVAEMIGVFQESFPNDTDEAAKRIGQWIYAMYNNAFVEFLEVDTKD